MRVKRDSKMRVLVQAEGSLGFFHPASVSGMNTRIGLSQGLGHVACSSARPGGPSGRLVQGSALDASAFPSCSELEGGVGRSGRLAVPS